MKLTYSKKILILSGLALVVVLTLDIIFTNLLLEKIVSINNKVKQLDISSQERLKELTLKDFIATSKAERERLDGYFVGAGDIGTVTFTKYLEDLAKTFGVTQKKTLAYEPAPGLEASEVVSAIRFKFNVTGSWSSVFGFLQAVENLPKVSSLSGVAVSWNPEDKVWSADLDFSVIKLK